MTLDAPKPRGTGVIYPTLGLGLRDDFDRVVGGGSLIETFSRVVASGLGTSEFGPPWGAAAQYSVDGAQLAWPPGDPNASLSSSATVMLPLVRPIEVLIRFRFTGSGLPTATRWGCSLGWCRR